VSAPHSAPERCRYGCDGYFANRLGRQGFIATGEPQADAFEEGWSGASVPGGH
jgi:hypothetical protein